MESEKLDSDRHMLRWEVAREPMWVSGEAVSRWLCEQFICSLPGALLTHPASFLIAGWFSLKQLLATEFGQDVVDVEVVQRRVFKTRARILLCWSLRMWLVSTCLRISHTWSELGTSSVGHCGWLQGTPVALWAGTDPGKMFFFVLYDASFMSALWPWLSTQGRDVGCSRLNFSLHTCSSFCLSTGFVRICFDVLLYKQLPR